MWFEQSEEQDSATYSECSLLTSFSLQNILLTQRLLSCMSLSALLSSTDTYGEQDFVNEKSFYVCYSEWYGEPLGN